MLGMFLNEDSFEGSLKTPPSLHRYLYAAGNPVIYVDASGNFFILGGMADELANMRNRVVDTADSFSNDSSYRGVERVAAAAGGIGAGVFGILEGGVRVVNYLGNAAVEGLSDSDSGNSESYFVQSAREELAASNAAIGKAYETIKEHPREVGAAIVNSVVETGAGVIEGKPGAIARGFSTVTEAVGGGGVVGASAKVTGQVLNATGKGVKKVVDRLRVVPDSGSTVADEIAALGRVQANQSSSAGVLLNQKINLRGEVVTRRDAIKAQGGEFSLSGAERGPVLGGIKDTRTGETFFGLNTDNPTVFHPQISERLNNHTFTHARNRDGIPHGEISALNKALLARGADTKVDLSEFLNFNARFSPNNSTSILRCEDCRVITSGVQPLSDRF